MKTQKMTSFTKGNIKLINADCMEIMKSYPDNYFDCAVVDPPYGIGASRATGTYARKATNYTAANDKKWDETIPEESYFNELFRVSKNQIIWGGNYMSKFLPSSQGWICWYKTDELKGRDFSEFELAFTSFKKAARHIELRPFIKSFDRIHPTQKPVKLYNFCFDYAKATKDFKILDTHGGSFNSAISAFYFGVAEFVGCEIDAEYYHKSVKRFQNLTMEQRISFD